MFRLPGPAAVLAAGLALSPAAPAQQPPQDLSNASLEELMNIKVVSVGKKAESLKTAAASVFVITADDIHRSGMHSLPEVLRLAPGVQVDRTVSGHWAISIRGFNGDFANKLLVLIDGRTVYNEEWAGVFWDMEELPVENVERIEIVRGPAAAMWGPNAVNGVINILTKNAQDTQGSQITAEAGTKDVNTSARYGGSIGSDLFYRFTARYGNYDALPSQAPPSAGGFTSANGWTSDSLHLRIDGNPTPSDSYMLYGVAYHSDLGEPAIFVTPQNPTPAPVDTLEKSTSGNFTGKWTHTFKNGSTLEARATWDHVEHGLGELPVNYTAIDTGLQYHFNLGDRNDLVWGVTTRDAYFDSSAAPGHSLTPSRPSLGTYSTFFEDQIALAPDRFFFIAGANIGHNSFTGLEVEPTARLLWTPTSKLTSWAAVSRAVRTPSLIERGMDFNLYTFPAGPGLLGMGTLVGNPNAGSESVLAYEAGQRVEAGKRVSLDLSLFLNRYQHLLFFAPAPASLVFGQIPYLEVPSTFDNAYYGSSHGLELSATWNAARQWRLTAGYSLLHVTVDPYPGWAQPILPMNNAPVSQWQLRSNLDLTRKIQLDAALYYTSAIPEDSVRQHLRGDLRLGWRFSDRVEFSLGVQDAFEPYHLELPSLYQGQSLLVGRDFYGAFTWRF